MKRGKKSGQVWVETVVYTLIAFLIIGFVLSYAKPHVNKLQDKLVLEQSLNIMQKLDDIFAEIVEGGYGNQRNLEINMKKGSLRLDCENDQIVFEMEGLYQYGENLETYEEGNYIFYVKQLGDEFFTNITRSYVNYNLTFQETDELKTIPPSTVTRRLLIINQGKDSNNNIIINMNLIS